MRDPSSPRLPPPSIGAYSDEAKPRHAALDLDARNEEMDRMVERFHDMGLVPNNEIMANLYFRRTPL